MSTQKITPNLWCDHNAQEAVDFYVSAFPDGKIIKTSNYPKSAEEGLADFQKDLAGQVLSIQFKLGDLEFVVINAGSEFTYNPSQSFILNFDPSKDDQAREHLDELWAKLIEGGEALMPLQEYPFSKHYGWVKDKFGLSWQLMLTNPAGESRPFITPAMMFGGSKFGQSEEAVNFYLSVFKDARLGNMTKYDQATDPDRAGAVMFADFMLEGQWFAAMDSTKDQDFTFNEALSLSISCKDQAEIDYYWDKLSVVPESEVCGWCKDKFGISWQIAPYNADDLLKKPGAFAKMMNMKKLIIADF